MANDIAPRVKVPATAQAGEVISIKTLVKHQMETGQRKDADGNVIPRSIINRFVATFNGETVVDVEMHPAIAVNPYFEFDAKVSEAGEFVFTWYDDDGSVYEEKAAIAVG